MFILLSLPEEIQVKSDVARKKQDGNLSKKEHLCICVSGGLFATKQ